MKAIVLKEPYAGMVRAGKKTIETRVWKTNYRGKLLICASKIPRTEFSGKAIAIAELVDCRTMIKADEKRACCKVYDRAHSWVLEDIRPIKPFSVRGQLSLFEVDIKE